MSVAPPPDESAAPPAESVVGDCPRCGAAYGPGQEYCLDCGARLPVGGVVATLSTAWRRRLPYYPGDWIWPVLVCLLIAGIATGVVIAANRKPAHRAVIVATGPISTVRSTTTTTTASTQSTTRTTTTRPRQPPPPPPPPAAPIAWPRGKNGFTVVLESIPATSGRAAAQSKARAALRGGLKNVGVLDSARYSSLHTGYFVVFSGVYDSQGEAQSAAASAKASGYADAYPARIAS
jgi:hypothetical protein